MTDPEGADELRARLRRAEEDAAAARILAGGADRDVGELGREFRDFRSEMYDFRSEMHAFRDQNNRVLSAMRADLVDLRRHLDGGFAEIRGLLDGQAAWNQRLADMLGVLIRQQGDEPPDRA